MIRIQHEMQTRYGFMPTLTASMLNDIAEALGWRVKIEDNITSSLSASSSSTSTSRQQSQTNTQNTPSTPTNHLLNLKAIYYFAGSFIFVVAFSFLVGYCSDSKNNTYKSKPQNRHYPYFSSSSLDSLIDAARNYADSIASDSTYMTEEEAVENTQPVNEQDSQEEPMKLNDEPDSKTQEQTSSSYYNYNNTTQDDSSSSYDEDDEDNEDDEEEYEYDDEDDEEDEE